MSKFVSFLAITSINHDYSIAKFPENTNYIRAKSSNVVVTVRTTIDCGSVVVQLVQRKVKPCRRQADRIRPVFSEPQNRARPESQRILPSERVRQGESSADWSEGSRSLRNHRICFRPMRTPCNCERDSEDWKAFMRHAAIARGKLPSAVSDERAADVEEMFRKLGRRLHDSWVKARHLEQWSSTREAQGSLPTLVRQLIHASTEQPTRIEMPGGEGVQRHGWDGVVEAPRASLFVPAGVSGWEISVEQQPEAQGRKRLQ